MEHRRGSRKSAVIPVELFRDGKSCGRYYSTNIGHGGLLVNCHGALKKGDVVFAKMPNIVSDTIDGSDYLHNIKVMVVHESNRGVGLMWADYNIRFFNQLEVMLSKVA